MFRVHEASGSATGRRRPSTAAVSRAASSSLFCSILARRVACAALMSSALGCGSGSERRGWAVVRFGLEGFEELSQDGILLFVGLVELEPAVRVALSWLCADRLSMPL